MGRVPAVGSSDYVTTKACGATWKSVTGCATIGQTRADNEINLDICLAIAFTGDWSKSFSTQELSLKELATATDCAEGIARDDESGGIRRHHISPTGADLLGK
jgi:hypothetical protein